MHQIKLNIIHHLFIIQTPDANIGVRILDSVISDVLMLIAASAFYGLWTMWDFFFDDHNNTSEVVGTNSLICLVRKNIKDLHKNIYKIILLYFICIKGIHIIFIECWYFHIVDRIFPSIHNIVL